MSEIRFELKLKVTRVSVQGHVVFAGIRGGGANVEWEGLRGL